MSSFVYPAIFHANEDNTYTVTFPDLPGCVTEGKSQGNAVHMAQDAMAAWLEYTLEHKEPVPAASDLRRLDIGPNEFTSLVCADVRDGRAVRRTVSLPKWMDDKAVESGLSLSKVLQDALDARLNT